MKILLTTSEIGDNAGGLAYHSLQLKCMLEKMGHIVFTEVLLDDSKGITVFDGGYDIFLGKKIRKAYKLKQINTKYALLKVQASAPPQEKSVIIRVVCDEKTAAQEILRGSS